MDSPPPARPLSPARLVLVPFALFGLTLLVSGAVVIGAFWLALNDHSRSSLGVGTFLLLDGTLGLGVLLILGCLLRGKLTSALAIGAGLLPVVALACLAHALEGPGPLWQSPAGRRAYPVAAPPAGPDSLRVYASAEQYPTLPDGGDLAALDDTLVATTRRLLAATGRQPGDEPATGAVTVSFVVGRRGDVSHITLEQGLTPTADDAVLAAVRRLPRLRPGRRHGQPVAVRLNLGVHLTTPRW